MWIADDDEPGIMLITEVISKCQINPMAPALLNIDGYNCTSNFDPNTVDSRVSEA